MSISLLAKLPTIMSCTGCQIIKKDNCNEVVICEPCKARWDVREKVLNAMTMNEYIREVAWGRADVGDSQKHYEALYERYMHEMPYGTAKCRTGDPYEWITDRIMRDYPELVEAGEYA
jgi:hypothetical protein